MAESLWLSSSVENRHTWQPNDSMHQEGTHSYLWWGCSLAGKLQTRVQFISHKTEANANSHKDKQNTGAILLSRWDFPWALVLEHVSRGQSLWAIRSRGLVGGSGAARGLPWDFTASPLPVIVIPRHHRLQDSKQNVTSCLMPLLPCLPCYGGPCLSFPWDGVWTTGKDTVISLGGDMDPYHNFLGVSCGLQ